MRHLSSCIALLTQFAFIATAHACDGTGSLVSQGITRTFVYHAPGATVPVGRPLIIAFHGPGGTGAGLKAYCGLDAMADANNLVVVYPNSTTIGGDLQWNVYADGQPEHGDSIRLIIKTFEAGSNCSTNADPKYLVSIIKLGCAARKSRVSGAEYPGAARSPEIASIPRADTHSKR